jgi:hypothetical protein
VGIGRQGGYRDDNEYGGHGVVEGKDTPGVFVYQSFSGNLGQGTGGTFGGEPRREGGKGFMAWCVRGLFLVRLR